MRVSPRSVAAPGSGAPARNDLERRLEGDVGTEAVPHGAVAPAGELDRTLDPVTRDRAAYHEVKGDPRDVTGRLASALAHEPDLEPVQGEASLLENVRHVDGHTAREADGQRLRGRGSSPMLAVDDQAVLPRARLEPEVSLPGELDLLAPDLRAHRRALAP